LFVLITGTLIFQTLQLFSVMRCIFVGNVILAIENSVRAPQNWKTNVFHVR